MSEVLHPLEEAGAALGAIVRGGVTAAGEVTRAAATRQGDRDRRGRQGSDDERRAIRERTGAEQHSAALAYGRGRDAWWDHATVDDVAGAFEAAGGWETRDPRAGIAMDEIRSRLQDRPELRSQLGEQYGLAFDDSRLRLDRERQAAEVPAAGLVSDAAAEATEIEAGGLVGVGAVLESQVLPGSAEERAAAHEVANLVEASFPSGVDQPSASAVASGPRGRHAGRSAPRGGQQVPRERAAQAPRNHREDRAVGR